MLGLVGVCSGLAGCSKAPPEQTGKHEHNGVVHQHSPNGEHDTASAGHEGHDVAPLNDADVAMPTSFPGGIERLDALLAILKSQIDHDELPKVHRTAEEMALVAKRLKSLAQAEIPQDSQLEVGRLCNQIAGLYPVIDEAADAGKKTEAQAVFQDISSAIDKLKQVAK